MKRTFSPASSQQAFDWVDKWNFTATVQHLSLLQAAGYLLAEEVKAGNDIPAQALCARDGYALRAADTLGAGDYNPLPLNLLNGNEALYPNSAIQVCCGDILPAGADAVLSLEQADVRKKLLDVASSLAPGDGVIQRAEECHQHDILQHAGRWLRPQDLARLSLAGITEVKVFSKPRIQLYITGQFEHEANSPMLSSLINRDGGNLISTQLTTSAEQLAEALSQSEADLILLTGGSGYGSNDYAFKVLYEIAEIELDGSCIHPGGSVILGKISDRPVIILPGSPLPCLCAYDLIASRLLRRFSARKNLMPYRSKTFTLSRKLVSRIGQFELARMSIDGNFTQSLAVVDDRLLSSSTRGDGFVLLPENSEGFVEGSQVKVYLYDEYN